MGFYQPFGVNALEPDETNLNQWLDAIYSRFMPLEQARWNQSNIDTLFYAGSQQFINRYFNYVPSSSYQNFYFNLLQQPVNMVTGYQRQHRKSINFIPTEGSDSQTTDQYTRLLTHLGNSEDLNEIFSKGCELSAISGLVLAQPYLDFTKKDPLQGDLNLKIWEYNSFLIDPYWRSSDMSDCTYIWCQEYITHNEAKNRFPDKSDKINLMPGTPQRFARFYFLPENYNMARNDLLVISYVWYKSKRKRKKLYSASRHQFFDIAEEQVQLDPLLAGIPDLEVVEVEVPSWKLAVVLNDQLMFLGFNPLGFDECPMVPLYWNYEPWNNYYDLRVRSLVRTMRDSQFLLNRRIILNHDITEATINAGWKRKVGAVANEDNLKKSGQGWDVVVNEGYDMTDVEKIVPSGVPESDMALAEQMKQLIFATSGVDLENWSAQGDKNASSLTVLLKQGANLMVLQKYFDQWDMSLKQLGEKYLKIILNNWNVAKISMLLGEEPSPFFYSYVFANYKAVVTEGLNTAIQRQQEFQQTIELNQILGGIIPPSYIASVATLQGKSKLEQILAMTEQQQQAVAQEAQKIAHAVEDAKLKELYSKTANNLAMAQERHGRNESNVGLFEERLSEVQKNKAEATKAKMEAIEKLVDVIAKYGEVETALAQQEIATYDFSNDLKEDADKNQAKQSAQGNKFLSEFMAGMAGGNQ